MKTKIVFAGVMGAILMSVGANAATTLATKGYVDQQVDAVNTTITNLDSKYVTIQQVTDAIDKNVDLTPYQTIANISQTLNGLSDELKAQKYPSVAAVADAIANLDLGLTTEQIEQLQNLIKSDGVVSQISALQGDVAGLKTQVGTGTVANQIADAIATHKTQADNTYQAKSTADLQIGTTGGVFRDMTDAEKAALASGITKTKVTDYDATKTAVDELTAEGGAIKELQTVVGDENSGLVKDVAANKTAIAANTAAIANKITMPAACASGNQTCVLMVANGNVSWTPVTSPVEDPVTGGTTGEAIGG